VIDGRQEYKKGSYIGWAVDPEEYAIVELVKDVQAYYHWANYQDVEFWYFCQGNDYVKLCSDAELLCLLRAHRKVRFDMKVVGGEHATDRQLALVSEMEEELVFLDDNGVQLDDFHILKDPLFGQTVARPSRADEEET